MARRSTHPTRARAISSRERYRAAHARLGYFPWIGLFSARAGGGSRRTSVLTEGERGLSTEAGGRAGVRVVASTRDSRIGAFRRLQRFPSWPAMHGIARLLPVRPRTRRGYGELGCRARDFHDGQIKLDVRFAAERARSRALRRELGCRRDCCCSLATWPGEEERCRRIARRARRAWAARCCSCRGRPSGAPDRRGSWRRGVRFHFRSRAPPPSWWTGGRRHDGRAPRVHALADRVRGQECRRTPRARRP